MKKHDIGFEEAFYLAMQHAAGLGTEKHAVMDTAGRIVAEDVYAMADSPSVDASLKDGFALLSQDLSGAAADSPVSLEVAGTRAAGDQTGTGVTAGKTIRVLTGAPVPDGADAVLAEEFAQRSGGDIQAVRGAEKGRNILPKGADVKQGDLLIKAGDKLTPSRIGLLAAGGISMVRTFRKPRIGLLATGSEVVLPGGCLEKGQLFASNAASQKAWLTMFGMKAQVMHAPDRHEEISDKVTKILLDSDVLVTSGGTWKGDRDLMVNVLRGLGADILFHRTRMGPGKAVGMAMLEGKPVFCLPGGPTSNEITFLMIALPAILKIAGHDRFPFLQLEGRLETEIKGQKDWTQFVQCRVVQDGSEIMLKPIKMKSRLVSMAQTHAIVVLPEGIQVFAAGSLIPFTCLDQRIFASSFFKNREGL